MSETRKIAAILVADVVGYSRLAGADEDRTLARLRGLRSDLIDPAIAAHHGRIVKRTDGARSERAERRDDGLVQIIRDELAPLRDDLALVRCSVEAMAPQVAGIPLLQNGFEALRQEYRQIERLVRERRERQ
jgi:hypothetical protein